MCIYAYTHAYIHICVHTYMYPKIINEKKEALNLKYSEEDFMGILEGKKWKTEML